MAAKAQHGRAATSADAADPVLRDRLLAVPFEAVWQAAGRLAAGGLRGWSLVSSDDQDGVIEATATGLGGGWHDVRVDIGLDDNGQTYVRAVIEARQPGADYGRARRRLRRFMKALDASLARSPRRGTRQRV
jgi:hypothetical protein